MRQAHSRAGIALVGTATLVALAACGGGSSGGGSNGGSGNGGNAKKTVVGGSADKPVTYDPAGAYDLPSWNVIYNVYQNLLRVDPATEKNVPDAADSCDPSADFQTWTGKLKAGLKFSNGDPLPSADVKFSFDRVIKINDPSGPSSLLAKVKTEAPDPQTVVFHLASGNALWDYILSTGAGATAASKVSPAYKKIADEKIVGSGPYQLTSYKPTQVAQFKPNP